jgi:lambda repressor-like predicted transcriptional regulator
MKFMKITQNMRPEEIRAQMVLKGISQVSLAQKVGVHPVMISRVIYGRGTSRKVREIIATAIDCQVSDIWPPRARKTSP